MAPHTETTHKTHVFWSKTFFTSSAALHLINCTHHVVLFAHHVGADIDADFTIGLEVSGHITTPSGHISWTSTICADQVKDRLIRTNFHGFPACILFLFLAVGVSICSRNRYVSLHCNFEHKFIARVVRDPRYILLGAYVWICIWYCSMEQTVRQRTFREWRWNEDQRLKCVLVIRWQIHNVEDEDQDVRLSLWYCCAIVLIYGLLFARHEIVHCRFL